VEYNLSDQLVVMEGVTSVSRAFELMDGNAVEVMVEVMNAGSSFSLSVRLDESNTGNNWFEVATLVEPVGVGKTYARQTGLSARFCRLRF